MIDKIDIHNPFFKASRLDSDFHYQYKEGEFWNMLAERYVGWLSNNLMKPIVPKKIHQIWIGSQLPEKYKNWTNSWKKYHPDFEYKLWDERDILNLNLLNHEQFVTAKNPAVKSDIARYEILNRFGGIYADTDFECLKRFDERFFSYNFIAGQVFSTSPQVNNALMISAPNSLCTKELIQNLPKYRGPLTPMETLEYCGAIYMSKILKKIFDDDEKTIALPSNYFYPWPNFHLKSHENRYTFLADESVAIHHWEVSWLRRSFSIRALKKLRSYL